MFKNKLTNFQDASWQMRVQKLKQGFSMIEMLVVVGIIVVLAALAAPSIVGLISGTGASQGYQTISGVVSTAHHLAITERAPYYIEVDYAANPPIFKIREYTAGSPGIIGKIVQEESMPEGTFIEGYVSGSAWIGSTATAVDLLVNADSTTQIIDPLAVNIKSPIRPHVFKGQATNGLAGPNFCVFSITDSNENTVLINVQALTTKTQSFQLN